MLYLLKIFFTSFYKNLIEIIFPEFCVGCNKLNTLLCNKCFEELEFIQFNIDINKKSPSLKTISCCCYYEGLAKKLIHEFKYKSVINVGKTIAHIMFYTCSFPEFDAITYVPMHKKKLGQRGFNQAQVIAQELGKLFNKPVANLLIKTKNTKSQMSLGKKINRKKNIDGSISLNPLVIKNDIQKFKSILIIDDVLTSGTTLNYCAKVLNTFGFKEVHAACFLFRN